MDSLSPALRPRPGTAAPDPYGFDTVVDRRGTWCTQWDYVEDRFGVPDLLPFTISDMDFETAPEVVAALRGRLDHGVLGYSRWRQDDFLSAIVHWYATRHATAVDPGSVVYAPSVVYQLSQLLRLWSGPGDGVVAHTPMYDAFPKTVAAHGQPAPGVPARRLDGAGTAAGAARHGGPAALLAAQPDGQGLVRGRAGPDGAAVRAARGGRHQRRDPRGPGPSSVRPPPLGPARRMRAGGP